MKILLISNMYPSKNDPDFGVFVRNFEENLKKQHNISFSLSVIKGRNHGVYSKLKAYLGHFFSVTYKCLRNDYDLIYVHFISHNSPILFLPIILKSNNKPIVVNVHGADIIKYNTGTFKFFNEFLVKRTQLLVVPSSYFKSIVSKEFPFYSKNRIYVNPSGGIDLKKFYPKQLKNSIKDEVYLGFVSRIEGDKGWEDYIDTIIAIRERDIPVKGIIIGTGSQVDLMLSKIKDNQLNETIDYIGTIEQSKLNDIYNGLDIFIFSSKRKAESLGLVGLEAMACGTPVIAYDMAGPKTYIEHGKNGFLASPGKPKEIVQCILHYIALEEEKKVEIRGNAIATAKDFDNISITKSLYNTLSQLVSEN